MLPSPWRPGAAAAPLLAAVGALLLATARAEAEARPQRAPAPEDAGGLLSALEVGDECAAAGAEGTTGSCALSALQLRGIRRAAGARRAHSARAAVEQASVAAGWAREGRCEGSELHELGFVVNQPGEHKVREMALDRSNPASPNYRRWLPWEEVARLSRSEESVAAVRAAVEAVPGGVVLGETVGGELVRARAPVRSWEQFLSTEFHIYRHGESQATSLRAPDFLLPRHLADHVRGVLNAVDIEDIRPQKLPGVDEMVGASWGYATFQDLVAAKGDAVIDPIKIRKVYNVAPIAARGTRLAKERANTSQCVYATLGQHWSPNDRTRFQSNFQIPTDNYVRQLDHGDGKSGDQVCMADANECAEANLDVQYMMAMAPWARMGYWYKQDADAKGMYSFLRDFSEAFAGTLERPPHVISISYGMPEFAVDTSGIVLFETLAQKLALAGVTILVASGDDGAASFLARKLLHGEECWSVPLVGLQVSWPASSAWVTAVGATLGAATGKREIACSVNATGPAAQGTDPLITTGGGFSQALKRPTWQGAHSDEDGRGIPDVSLVGHAYAVVIGGRWVTVDGTSAAAPTFGGMLSLINSKLIAQGKPTIGFLNYMMYTNASSAFIDVVEGDNRCAATGYPCCGGYDAVVGWDATTGLGVPNWAALQAALLKR